MFRKALILAALLGAFIGSPAHAACTVNSVPQVGVICDINRNATYSAASIGLVPAAAATDLFCISAGSTKNITVRQIAIGGTAGTAITTPFIIYKRSALGTGGTAATAIALPVPTPLGGTDPVSTATLTAYTANPTVAASPIVMDVQTVSLAVTTTANNQPSPLFYGTSSDFLSKGLDIVKGSTTQICVNLNGVTVTTGVLNISMQWTEQ